ncbi:MAG: T9SS type A sorting domain-containing protein [Ferruginibacter sp.]
MPPNSTQAIAKNLAILLLITCSKLSAQTITPFTLNIGGGTAASGYYQFDWSIGEGSSINAFSNNSTLIVSSGILQPFTGVAVGNNLITAAWAKGEIAVFPVPTNTILEIDIKLAVTGKLTLQIFSAGGSQVLTKIIDYYQTNSIQKLDLSALAAGSYFMNVTLNSSTDNKVIRKSAFKIQKL